MENEKEHLLYPIVEKWMIKNFLCFKTDINKGLKYGRIDIDMGIEHN